MTSLHPPSFQRNDFSTCVNFYIPCVTCTGHCSFVSCLLALGSSSLLSIGWDCHLLFWQEIEPIRLTNREVFPVEESQPQSGFKLGPSTVTEYLPLSVCEVAGFGVLVLFTNTTRDVDITYYTFSHVPSS